MAITFNRIMKKSDWIKLCVLIVVGVSAITFLYGEYQKTNDAYNNAIMDAMQEARQYQ